MTQCNLWCPIKAKYCPGHPGGCFDFEVAKGFPFLLSLCQYRSAMPKLIPPYFGGSSTNFGSIKALDAPSFRQLVEGTLMLARRLGSTRAHFLELPKKQRDNMKRTAFLIAASMKEDPSDRLLQEAEAIRLVFLDIDDPHHARPLYDNPGLLTSMVEPFSFCLYTTANHTKEEPRLRLVVDADISSPKEYPSAVETVAAMAGVPFATTESKVAVQPMYLPVIFKDEDPDFDHPILHYRTDGRPMTDDDIDPTLSGDRSGSYSTKSSLRGEDGFVDALEFLSSPVEDMTLAQAEEMLGFLDPDLPYQEWLNVCFALKHQFGDTEEEDDALDIFDLWSAGGEKYDSRDDILAKWRSARPASKVNGRSPVTMRSIMRLASAKGWNPGTDFLEFVESTDEVERALRGIAAAGLSPMNEEAALLKLSKAAKQGGISFGLPFLRKRLAKEKQLIQALDAESNDEPPPAWAKGFVHVAATNDFHRHITGEAYSPDAVDNQFGRYLLEKAGNAEDDPSLGSRPPVRPRDYLLNMLKIPAVYAKTYEPRRMFDHIVQQEGKDMLNTYIPSWPDPDEETMEAAGKIFTAHLENLIAEPEYRRTLLDFLAWQVQHPGEKVRWAVLLQGAQGCGKTLLLEVMAYVLGRSNVKSVEASVLFSSQYNDWAKGSQVVGLEEIRVVGHNRHEVMNRLKPCITNSRISINEKWHSILEYENVTNYLLFTNFHDALAVSDGDRRYFVLKSPLQTRRQVEALGENYFRDLFGGLQKNAGGLRAWFENYEISEKFDPDGHAPRTIYFDELLSASAPEDTATIRDVLYEGTSPVITPHVVDSTTLTAALEMAGISLGGQKLASILREEGYRNLGRKYLAGCRRTIWCKPEYLESKSEEVVWDRVQDLLETTPSKVERDLLGEE